MTEISTTEKIMRNRAETCDGWAIENGFRNIRVGNVNNCNLDGIIRNYKIKDNMNDILTKYDIKQFELKEINNEFEHSYKLELREEIYTELKNKLLNNVP